jgi:hypothetical protein
MHVLHQHVLNHCKFLLMAVPMPPLHLRHRHCRRQPEKQRGIFEAFACLPIAFAFIGTIAGLKCILGLIRKLICSANAMTDDLGYSIRITESDKNVRRRFRELVEAFCVM